MRFLNQRVQSESNLTSSKPALKDLTPKSLLSATPAVPTVKQRQMLLLQKSGVIVDSNANNNNTGNHIKLKLTDYFS